MLGKSSYIYIYIYDFFGSKHTIFSSYLFNFVSFVRLCYSMTHSIKVCLQVKQYIMVHAYKIASMKICVHMNYYDKAVQKHSILSLYQSMSY